MMYTEDMMFNYISGSQIDEEMLERLESNERFMTCVIKITNDRGLYNHCSNSLKRNINFVKFLIDHFQKDISFVLNVAHEFMINGNPTDIEELELTIILGNLFDKTKDERLSNFKLISNKLYLTFVLKIENFINSEKDEESEEDYGLGFAFILDNFEESPIILDMFAENMLSEYIHDNKFGLEITAHEYFETVEELEKYGEKNFILDYVEILDQYLAYYISNNIHLITPLENKIKRIKKNWNNYIERQNKCKVDMVFDEMCDYVDSNDLFEIDCQEELVKIIKKLGLEEIFKKYPIIIDFESNDELIEEEFLDFDEESSLEESNEFSIRKIAYIKHMTNYIEKLFSKTCIYEIEEQEQLPKEKTKAKIINYDFKERKVISITE